MDLNESPKVVISVGHGRLHFVETVNALHGVGLDPRVITGWIPKSDRSFGINFLGRCIGRSNLSKRLSVRRQFLDSSNDCISLARAEVYVQVLQNLAKFGVGKHSKASKRGWEYFGKSSREFLFGDIFHVRSGAGQGGAIRTARERGMKVVVDHSIAHPQSMDRALRKQYLKVGIPFELGLDSVFWRQVLKDCDEADVLLVNSDFVKQTFVEAGFDETKIEVQYLGLRPDFFDIKKNYEIDGKLRILFTGVFGLRKGAAEIVEAARLLKARGVEFEFVIVGRVDQAMLGRLENFDEVRGQFHFAGFVSQDALRSYFSSCDIYVFPSYAEGCAKSLVEAMGAGLPVVCTFESGGPVIDEVNGLLVNRGDAQDLVSKICHLSKDASYRRRLGRNAVQTVSTRCNWNEYGLALRALYERLLGC